jgi:hypothetical protein
LGVVTATNINLNFIQAFVQGYFSNLGVALNGTIDIVDLNKHDMTEQDALLSRLDIIQGSTLTV